MKGLAGVSSLGQSNKTRLVYSETNLYCKRSIAHSLSIKFSIKDNDFLVELPRKIVFCDYVTII